MKKKIFCIAVIVMLMANLFILTGCGNNNSGEEDESSSSGENDKSISNEDNKEEAKEEIQVEDVLAISENYAVVTGTDNSTYIIDKNGNYQGSISTTSDKILINPNGYVAVNSGENLKRNVTIYDKTGKVLFEKDENTSYAFVITDSDLLIRTTTDSSFSGSSSKTEIIDVNGNVKFENSELDSSCEYIGYDIVATCDIGLYNGGFDADIVYDLKTNTKIDIDTCYDLDSNSNVELDGTSLGLNYKSSSDEWEFNNIKHNDNILQLGLGSCYLNSKNKIIYAKESSDEVLSDEYYYSNSKKAICTYDGTVVKDLSDGNGASYIGYYGDKFYIKSGTGYYYVLDKDFNRIIEPTEAKHIYNINSYGIICSNDDSTSSILYDFDLKNEKQLSYKLDRDPEYFVAEIKSTNNSKAGYFNLNTQEKLVIYK